MSAVEDVRAWGSTSSQSRIYSKLGDCDRGMSIASWVFVLDTAPARADTSLLLWERVRTI
jgi:hypothetical protein